MSDENTPQERLAGAPGSAERVVCEYRGRVFTEGRAPNGMPIIHYFEGRKEYGLINDDEQTTIRVLKHDIDVRDGIPPNRKEVTHEGHERPDRSRYLRGGSDGYNKEGG